MILGKLWQENLLTLPKIAAFNFRLAYWSGGGGLFLSRIFTREK